MKIKNKHKCPAKIWNKFSLGGAELYNRIMDINKKTVCPVLKVEDWTYDVIAHNLACLAVWDAEDIFGQLLRRP